MMESPATPCFVAYTSLHKIVWHGSDGGSRCPHATCLRNKLFFFYQTHETGTVSNRPLSGWQWQGPLLHHQQRKQPTKPYYAGRMATCSGAAKCRCCLYASNGNFVYALGSSILPLQSSTPYWSHSTRTPSNQVHGSGARVWGLVWCGACVRMDG